MPAEATRILEAAADVILWVGPDGRIRWFNGRAAELGLDVASLEGSSLEVLTGVALAEGEATGRVPAEGHEIPVAISARRLDEGWAVQLRDLRPWSGPVTAHAGPGADGERVLGAVMRGALRTAGDEFEGEERSDVIAQVLAEQSRRLIRGADCLIAIVEAGRPGVFRVAGAAGAWARPLAGQELNLEGSLVGQALAQRRVFETSTAAAASSHGGTLAGGGIRTVRLMPIVFDQPLPDGRTALGTIGFYSTRAQPFSAHQRRLMDDFASLVALALMRAALRRAGRLSAERLEMSVELAVELGRSLDVRVVVGRLLDMVLEVLDTDRAVLLRVEGDETVTEDSRDRLGFPDVVGFRHPIAGQPLMAAAISNGAPVAGGRYLGGTLPGTLRAALGDVRHTLTVPLVLDGRSAAVLVLSRRRESGYGPDDIATIRLLASIAVPALRNAWLYAEAQEASRLRSDFLNMAAHELRTPFTVVAGYLSMLRDGSLGPVPPEWQSPLDTLDRKAAELGRLVEDLLLASRLDGGALPVRAEVMDLNLTAAAAVERARPRARLLGADLAADPAPRPALGLGDPDHVARIVDNLVNNALTYSIGRAWVRVRVRQARGGVRVEVEDRGRGIPAGASARVFERFYRVEDASVSGQSGTGLGLYISRELAERQGGRLELEWTRLGEGSRFVFTVPAGA